MTHRGPFAHPVNCVTWEGSSLNVVTALKQVSCQSVPTTLSQARMCAIISMELIDTSVDVEPKQSARNAECVLLSFPLSPSLLLVYTGMQCGCT